MGIAPLFSPSISMPPRFIRFCAFVGTVVGLLSASPAFAGNWYAGNSDCGGCSGSYQPSNYNDNYYGNYYGNGNCNSGCQHPYNYSSNYYGNYGNYYGN